jgi:hypothetical protein
MPFEKNLLSRTLQVPIMAQSTYAAPSMQSPLWRSSLAIILTSQLLTAWIVPII